VLTLKLVNDGTGDDIIGNYDVTVTVNTRVIWTGRVEGHDRRGGWPWLIWQLADVVMDEEA